MYSQQTTQNNQAPFVIGLVTLLAAGILQLGYAEIHADISWLLIVSQKLLEGSSLYVDIFEVNPPLSVGLYMPFVWLENHLPFSAESLISVAVFMLFVLNVFLANRLLLQQESAHLNPKSTLFLVLIALFFVPSSVFAQREHIGMICLIPFLVLSMLRLENPNAVQVSKQLKIVSGLLAAVIVCIKPYYVLAIVFPACVQIIMQRSIRPAFHVENLVAALIVCLYGLVVWVFFPHYLSFASSVLIDIYASSSEDKFNAVVSVLSLVGPAVVTTIVLSSGSNRSPVIIGGLSITLGFALACIWQGKAWDYHLFPVLVTAALTLAIAVIRAQQAGRLNRVAHILSGLALLPMFLFASQSLRNQTQFTHELAALDAIPKQQSTVVMTQSFKLLHPVSRYINSDWQSAYSNDWIAGFGLKQLRQGDIQNDTRDSIMRHLRTARDKKRNELLARPDMIITVPTDTEVIDYFRQDPVIASIMDEYTHLKSIGGLAFHMRGTAEQPDDRHPTPGRNAHSLNPL